MRKKIGERKIEKNLRNINVQKCDAKLKDNGAHYEIFNIKTVCT